MNVMVFHQIDALTPPEPSGKVVGRDSIDGSAGGSLSVQPADYDADTEADASHSPGQHSVVSRRRTAFKKERTHLGYVT